LITWRSFNLLRQKRFPPKIPNEKPVFLSRIAHGALRQCVHILARQLEVRMLVIDEIHAMPSGTFREQRSLGPAASEFSGCAFQLINDP
jgi:hypothetical protein